MKKFKAVRRFNIIFTPQILLLSPLSSFRKQSLSQQCNDDCQNFRLFAVKPSQTSKILISQISAWMSLEWQSGPGQLVQVVCRQIECPRVAGLCKMGIKVNSSKDFISFPASKNSQDFCICLADDQLLIMKVAPTIVRNSADHSVTLSLPDPKCSIIWLHGLGGAAQNYLGFWKFRRSALHQGWRVKILQAPERWTTIREDTCPSWYDVRSFNRFTEEPSAVFDISQVNQSFKTIDHYVKEELQLWSKVKQKQGLPLQKRVYIGGMSQGGAMSLYYALSSAHLLGGAIALSSYLLPFTPLTNAGNVPLLLVHGEKDSTITEEEAKKSYSSLYVSGSAVEYRTFQNLEHSVCIQEIGMISEWLSVTHELHEVTYML